MVTPDNTPLSALLRRADPATRLAEADMAGDFSAAVRSRIGASQAVSPFATFVPGWLAKQALPLAAALAVIASLATGGGLAYAREQRANSEAFAAAYVRGIDPWLMHAEQASGLANANRYEHR